MENIQSQIAAATAERCRIESAVVKRHPFLEGHKKLIPQLMTDGEFNQWNSIGITVEEMSKYV